MAAAAAPCSSCTTRRGAQAQWRAAPAANRAPWPTPTVVAQRWQRGAPQVAHITDAASLQELIVGSAVTAATAAALINGSGKGDPEVCSCCVGTGGFKCFACEGSGKMQGISQEALAAARQRDPLGGSRSQHECVACKGSGKNFCKQCRGSGFSRRM